MHNTLILAWTFHCFCPAVLILCSSKCIFQTDFIKYGSLLKSQHLKAENVSDRIFLYHREEHRFDSHTPDTPIPLPHTPDIQPYHIHTHMHPYYTHIHTHSPSPTPTTNTHLRHHIIPSPHTTAFYNPLGILIFHQYLVLGIFYFFYFYFILSILLIFKTRFHCAALVVLELTKYIRLTLSSKEICWILGLEVCSNITSLFLF